MSFSEGNDFESPDFPSELINEAARLENAYLNEKMDKATEEAFAPEKNSLHESSSFDESFKSEQNGDMVPKSNTSKTDQDYVSNLSSRSKPDRGSKKDKDSKGTSKSASKTLKRRISDSSSDLNLIHAPEPKRLMSNFKIPKKSAKSSSSVKTLISSDNLTEDQKAFLAQLEKDFTDRYTNFDEDYRRVAEICNTPPVVENYFCTPRRRFSRQEGSSRYDRGSRNSSPFQNQGKSSYQSRYSDGYRSDRHSQSRYQPY